MHQKIMHFETLPGVDGPVREKDPGSPIPITSRFLRSMSTPLIVTSGSRRSLVWMIRPINSRIYLSPEREATAQQFFDQHGLKQFCALVPGTIWETKHWPPERFAEVGLWLEKQGFDVVLLGTDHDQKRCEKIKLLCGGAIDLSGQTTPAELCGHCEASCLMRDQRFRCDASCRGPRPSSGQRLRPDQSCSYWSVWSPESRRARRFALFAV